MRIGRTPGLPAVIAAAISFGSFGIGTGIAEQLAAIDDAVEPAPAPAPVPSSGPGANSVQGLPTDSCALDGPCTWERTFGGQLEDKAYAVAALDDDGIAVVGHSRSFNGQYDGWFLGLDRGGAERWQRVLGGPQSEQAYGVVATADGGVAVVGQTRSWGNGESDLWLVRLDAAGGLDWDRTIGGPGNDRGRTIAALPDGGFAIGGFVTRTAEHGRDAFIARLDTDGTILWQESIESPGDDAAFHLAIAPDGSLLVTGYRSLGGERGYDLWAARYDPGGRQIWQRLIDRDGFEAGTGIVALPDGGAAIAGVVSVHGGHLDARVLRLGSDGNVVWDYAFGGSGNESAWGIVGSEEGGVIVSGATESQGAGSTDGWIFALDADGAMQWERFYGGALWDRPMALSRAADGGLLVAGTTTTSGAGFEDFWVLRLDRNGNLQQREQE